MLNYNVFRFQFLVDYWAGDWSWIYVRNRTCHENLDGLKSFITVGEADMLNENKTATCCPCYDCENKK